MKIAPDEYLRRRAEFAAKLAERRLDGCVLTDRHHVFYYTGFAFVPTERPTLFVMTAEARSGMLVARIDLERVETTAGVDEVVYYDEYPGERHPLEFLRELLSALDLTGELGADDLTYSSELGYRGPSLPYVLQRSVTLAGELVDDQMSVKSAVEIALIRESCTWGNLAHTLLQRYTRPGTTETEASHRASSEATFAMLDAIGPRYRADSAWKTGAHAGYFGQIGRTTANPHSHSLTGNITFSVGDSLISEADAPVWGYHSELERMMIIGPPSDAQKRLFDHALALQDLALETIKPGIRCSEVDTTVRKYYERHGLLDSWRHHVGHAIGIRYHEGPFLDRGDPTEIAPGMVFTVEPGIYTKGVGGFRHSDTVLVTDDGVELLTYYPRDLESLTIPV